MGNKKFKSPLSLILLATGLPWFFALGSQSEQSLNPKVKMNDIQLGQFGDYTKEWKLITVRYRKDTGELRFTYANPVAYEAIQSGAAEYPDGSVFSKIGFKSGIDPAFNSSVVPSGTRRFQFMVKDKKKYAETDGWGYALFTSEGELFPGDMNVQTQSCHACHKLVPERNYVFSEKIEFSPFLKSAIDTYSLAKNKSHIFFEILKPTDPDLRALIRKHKVKELKVVAGDLRKHFFSGTLDEITPLLINELLKSTEAKTNASPATGFVSADEKTYKIVVLDKTQSCAANETGVKIFEMRPELEKAMQKSEKQLCYAHLVK